MMRNILGSAGAFILATTVAVASPPAPTLPNPAASVSAPDAPQVGDIAIPAIRHPYDEDADASKAVDAALAEARISGMRTLVVFGANWCPDCRALAGVLSLDQVKTWSDRHYRIVEVDVGRFNRNTDLADRFGVKLKAIPALVVVSPDGKVVNANETLALGDARTMSAQAVVDILDRWAIEAPAAPRPAG